MSTDKSAQPDSHRSILKSTSVIASGTLVSRVLGFVRDMILAKVLGTGLTADAFFVANKIPNLFRDLVGEGATNSSVVPVLTEYKARKDQEFWSLVNVILILGLMSLSVLTVLGLVFVDPIVRVIAPGFSAEPEKFQLTVTLTRIMFPYLVLIGLTAHSMAILYTFRSFVVPAFSPCLLNVAMIIGALVSVRAMDEPVYGIAVSVLVGGALQLAVQQMALRGKGMVFRRPETLNHPGAVQAGKLFVPRLIGSGVYQLTVFLETFCASLSAFVGPGGVSALYYANRLIQLPMGVFTVSLASAALPTMASLANTNDLGRFKRTLVFSLENIFFVMMPFSVFFIVLANPIIRILFERGQFDQYSTQITASALMCASLGLFSYGGIKIMVTAYHSLQDTKTPVKVAAACLVLNAALNAFFMFGLKLKVGGIPLASSIAATVNFVILFFLMEKNLGAFEHSFHVFSAKVLVATAVAGGVFLVLWDALPVAHPWVKLAVVAAAGFGVYGLVCLGLGVEQARKSVALLAEKLGRR